MSSMLPKFGLQQAALTPNLSHHVAVRGLYIKETPQVWSA
jgi:hypothetical protein